MQLTPLQKLYQVSVHHINRLFKKRHGQVHSSLWSSLVKKKEKKPVSSKFLSLSGRNKFELFLSLFCPAMKPNIIYLIAHKPLFG